MHTYSVQLRISGKTVNPGEITQRLGLRPNVTRLVGDRRSKGSNWTDSMWSYDGTESESDSTKQWDSLEEGLSFLLGKLQPKADQLRDHIKRCEVVWWCGHFQSSFDGGPTLSAALLRQLADFGAPLFIDNYFNSGDVEGATARAAKS